MQRSTVIAVASAAALAALGIAFAGGLKHSPGHKSGAAKPSHAEKKVRAAAFHAALRTDDLAKALGIADAQRSAANAAIATYNHSVAAARAKLVSDLEPTLNAKQRAKLRALLASPAHTGKKHKPSGGHLHKDKPAARKK